MLFLSAATHNPGSAACLPKGSGRKSLTKQHSSLLHKQELSGCLYRMASTPLLVAAVIFFVFEFIVFASAPLMT
jgi:hypothetical protein